MKRIKNEIHVVQNRLNVKWEILYCTLGVIFDSAWIRLQLEKDFHLGIYDWNRGEGLFIVGYPLLIWSWINDFRLVHSLECYLVLIEYNWLFNWLSLESLVVWGDVLEILLVLIYHL